MGQRTWILKPTGTQVQISAFPFTSWVTLGKLHNLSKFPLPLKEDLYFPCKVVVTIEVF